MFYLCSITKYIQIQMVKYDAKIMIKSIIHFCIQGMIANNYTLYLSIYNRNISCVCNMHIHTQKYMLYIQLCTGIIYVQSMLWNEYTGIHVYKQYYGVNIQAYIHTCVLIIHLNRIECIKILNHYTRSYIYKYEFWFI